MPDVIADRFELERLVGTGGMGEVFRAKDRVTGDAVAVKVLHASAARAAGDGQAARFRREAQLLADVQHPRVVRYVAHGVAGHRPYLVMEWLDGEELGVRLERGGLTLRESITVAQRTAEALTVLHDRGIVHRDIKPSNLFLVNGEIEQLKLLDLGIARLVHASRPSTRSGVMVGTPGYMAPEQARGHKEIDARADVFSLGCVLFECIAGKPAFHGDNIAALLAKILLEEPLGLRESGVDVPLALDDLVSRMLSKQAAARPPSAVAVARELESFTALADTPARAADAPKVHALTHSERRLVSVVMASCHEEPAATDPLLGGERLISSTAFETVAASFDPRTLASSFGAEAEILADGSIVVTLSGKGGASEQAAHAARCALALRSHLPSARVALATGLAAVTDRSCVGEVIDRAATILADAKSRQGVASDETLHGDSPVFLDETTAGLLDVRFDVGGDERGLFIRGLREREVRARTLLGKPTPFVGRDREMSTLLGIFEEAVGEPVARAVLVTGQAGAGKSRLTAEVVHRVKPSAEVWVARGDPMSEGSPFSLLARLLRRAAGIHGGEPLVVRTHKLRARVGRNVPEADVQRVAEFLGEIASVRFPDDESLQLRAARQDSMLMGDQMRRAFSDLVLAETRSAPLVIVLEDLHWGDLPTVTFIDAALRAAHDQPLVVLAVARGEVHESFPHLWEQRSLQEIRLGPLVRRAGERLVAEVLGPDVPADEAARLLDRAAGNAFYLEELIRAYAEGPVDSLPGGVAPPPSSASLDASAECALPGTVLATVEARLERLDPMARRVLRAASLFGEVFWRGGIVSLTGGDCRTSDVDDWLLSLARMEIVQRREVTRFPNEPEYAFRHAIVREAAYQMLTAEDRALGHRLAAEWLEGAGEHEAMVLGEHFERGDAKTRAATFYARAAEQALEGNDFGAARARAERAIQAGASGADLGRLHLLLAEACRWSGEHNEAAEHARVAMSELGAGSDAWHGAAAEAVEAATTMGRLEAARAVVASVRAGAPPEVPTAARVIGMCRVAVRAYVSGLVDDADAITARAEREAEVLRHSGADDRAGEAHLVARAFVLSARVTRAKWLGDNEQAVVLAGQAVTSFDAIGDVRNAAAQRDNAGYALVSLGAYAEAAPILREAVESAERLGLAAVANEAKLHLGHLYVRMLDKTEAIRTLNEVMGGFAAQGDRLGEGRAHAYLAGVYQLGTQHEEAHAAAMAAIPLLAPSPPYLAALYGLIALIRADRGDPEGALEAGREAMRLLERVGGAVEGESFVQVGYAEGLRATGDIEGSNKAIAAARDRLLARAAKIQKREWRRSFLDRVQEHLRILARAGEWLA